MTVWAGKDASTISARTIDDPRDGEMLVLKALAQAQCSHQSLLFPVWLSMKTRRLTDLSKFFLEY
jgi:hypothetical protein